MANQQGGNDAGLSPEVQALKQEIRMLDFGGREAPELKLPATELKQILDGCIPGSHLKWVAPRPGVLYLGRAMLNESAGFTAQQPGEDAIPPEESILEFDGLAGVLRWARARYRPSGVLRVPLPVEVVDVACQVVYRRDAPDVPLLNIGARLGDLPRMPGKMAEVWRERDWFRKKFAWSRPSRKVERRVDVLLATISLPLDAEILQMDDPKLPVGTSKALEEALPIRTLLSAVGFFARNRRAEYPEEPPTNH